MKRCAYSAELQRNSTCPICIDDFTGKDEVGVHEECKNGYHYTCLEEWVNSGKNSCPICRKNIK